MPLTDADKMVLALKGKSYEEMFDSSCELAARVLFRFAALDEEKFDHQLNVMSEQIKTCWEAKQ